MAQPDEWDDPRIPGTEEDEWAAPGPGSKPQVEQTRGLARLEMIPQAIMSGVQTALDIPGAIGSLINQHIVKPTPKYRRITEQDSLGYKTRQALTFPGTAIGNALNSGLERNPELTPDGPFERYGTAILKAAPEAAMIFASGGMGALPAAATAATGAVASQAAADLIPNPTWEPAVAGMMGSLGAGGIVGIAQKASAGRAALRAFESAQKKLDSATEDLVLAGDPALRYTPASQAKNELALAKETKFEGNISAQQQLDNITRAADERLVASKNRAKATVTEAEKQTGETFSSVANKFGTYSTPQQAGQVVQDSARNWWSKVMPRKMEVVSKPLDAAIPRDTPTSIFAFNGALNNLRSDAGKLQGVVDGLLPALPARLKKSLQDIMDDPAGVNPVAAQPQFSKTLLGPDGTPLQTGMSAASPGQPFTWGEVRELRSAIGNAMSNPKIVAEVGEQELKHLYATVTQDLRASAAEKGAVELFDAYNAESTRLYDFASNVVSKIVPSANKNLDTFKITPEKAATDLLALGKDGGTILGALRDEMPDATDALAAYQLRQGASGWGALKPEARKALAGAEESILDSSLTVQAQAAQNAERITLQATKDYDDLVLAAKDDFKTGKTERSRAVLAAQRAKAESDAQEAFAAQQADFKRRLAVTEAKKEVELARGQLPPPADSFGQVVRKYSPWAGSAFGAYQTNQLLGAMDIANGPLASGLVGLGALAVPAAIRGGQTAIRDPRLISVPIAGALTGQNALLPQR